MSKHIDVNEVNVDLLAKSKQSSATYRKGGRVSLALSTLDTPEAAQRRLKLGELEEVCRTADARVDAIDLATATRRATKMRKYVEVSADGVAISIATRDPALGTSLPVKTGFEYEDPVSYATKVVQIAEKGDSVSQAQAVALRGVVDTYVAGDKAKDQTSTDRDDARMNQAAAKHAFEAYISDCMKYVTENAPKGHVAHKHLKLKRAKSSREAAPSANPGPGAAPTTTEVKPTTT